MNYWQGKIRYTERDGTPVWRYSRPFLDRGQPTLHACYRGGQSGFQARLSSGAITGILNHLYDELVTREIYPQGAGGDCSTHVIQRAKPGTGFMGPGAIKLQIIDGGVEFLYDINNQSSVQEVEDCGCPPNTLDCGDCCLECGSILNQISSIRSLLSQI